MATKKKLLQAAAGQAGGAVLNIEDVFSTYLYEGNASGQGATAQSITNNIDLSGEGGLVWLKNRDSGGTSAWSHYLFDTERGATKYIRTNVTNGETTSNNSLSAFNSDGFTLGETGGTNNNGDSYASWTFRKAPKFFDVVTYTGNGTNGREISHNLGTTVGSVIIKCTSGTGSWQVWHREGAGSGTSSSGQLNDTAAFNSALVQYYFGDDTQKIDPTSTVFTVSDHSAVNASGSTYVAYLFAHNDGDGDFGPDADADIIKCGSFTTDANGDASIDLGFEPQWVLLKRTDAAQSWWLADTMRGMTVGTAGTAYLVPDQNYAEDSTYTNYINPTATGFGVDAFSGSANYIYIAIRRGPMAVPESATEVFAIDTTGSDGDGVAPNYRSGFPVDMAIRYRKAQYTNKEVRSRLTGDRALYTNSATDEQADTSYTPMFDFMNGYYNQTSTQAQTTAILSAMWQRAPNYFDVVAYTGNGTAGRTVSHNLGVAPEMMWVKNRNNTTDWEVYHSGLDSSTPQNYSIKLNESDARTITRWNNTAPTSSVFTVSSASSVNGNNETLIAYLFASLDGVSKVGSYTGNGTSQNIDCGFSSGARFVLIKAASTSGNWILFDSERGIVAGNDPFLVLNTTGAESSAGDYIDPYSAGFTLPSATLNTSGVEWIFYAIA